MSKLGVAAVISGIKYWSMSRFDFDTEGKELSVITLLCGKIVNFLCPAGGVGGGLRFLRKKAALATR